MERYRSKSRELQAKPLLFVDVDGVISLWGFDPDRRPEGGWCTVDGIVHFLSAEAGRHLLALAERFELVWATGWEEKANEYLVAALGLPRPLPHLVFDRPGGDHRGHWKLGAIEEHAGDRPLAWVDDAHTEPCRAWAEERPAPTLLVPTDPASGLTAAHVARLQQWATALGSPATG